MDTSCDCSSNFAGYRVERHPATTVARKTIVSRCQSAVYQD